MFLRTHLCGTEKTRTGQKEELNWNATNTSAHPTGSSEAEVASPSEVSQTEAREMCLCVECHQVGAGSPPPGKVNLDRKQPSVERNSGEALSCDLSADNIPRTWGNSCLVPAGGDLGGTPQHPP